MIHAATGIYTGTDDYAVGMTAATQALDGLHKKISDCQPTIAFVFASVKYNNEVVLKGIRSIIGHDAYIVGASTAGEITDLGPSIRESVAVLLIYSDTLKFKSAVASDLTKDSFKAGESIANDLIAKSPEALSLVMMFADGLKGNGSAIIRGLLSKLGEQFPIVGGSAGDDGKFVATQQFIGDAVYSDSVVGVGLSGEFTFSVGVNHGWSAVGAPRKVTGVDGAKIKMIDNLPAISLYETYLGPDEVKNLKEQTLGEIALSYPLGIKDVNSDEMLLRAPFGVDADGSVVCGGEVKVGDMVQLMVGTKEDAVLAAKKAAVAAMAGLEGVPKAAFVFSCHVRNTLFATDESARAETDAIQDVIGHDVPLIGFYTYAEQAPVGGATHNIKKCNPEFHNETVVLVLLGERA